MIVMVRADDRLIHGLVAVSWTSMLQPETILVADDVTASDSFKSMTMMLAKPAGVKMFIKTRDSAIKALNNPINDNKRIFLVVSSTTDAYYMFQQVKGIKSLNIGTAGVNKDPAKEYFATVPQVFMTREDFACAKKMHEAGVEVFAQVSPTLERMDFADIEKVFQKQK
jgi:PTS system mannose-specific IIB component/fructoselysine and glucoselysine-specific PTS system IIB component